MAGQSKSLSLLLATTFFLSSCSTTQYGVVRTPSSVQSETCLDIGHQLIMAPDKFTKGIEKFNSTNLATLLPDEDLKELQVFLTKLDITEDEAISIGAHLDSFSLNNSNLDMLSGAIYYSRLHTSKRDNVFKGLNQSFSNKDITYSDFTHFKKQQEKVSKYYQKQLKKDSESVARAKALNYQKLYYACKGHQGADGGKDAAKQAKQLTYALTAGGVGSSAATYTFINWDKEKDSRWYNELLFALGVSLVLGYINGKYVLANPKLHPWKGRMPLTFAVNAAEDAGVSYLYNTLFKASEAELEAKLRQIEADPDFMKTLEDLLLIAQEKGLFEKYITETENLFQGSELRNVDQIDFDEVDLMDSRELIFEAISEKEYQENSGLLSVGSPGLDRFSFHRGFDLLSIPTSILLSLIMQRQMCMATNPKKGFAIAVATFMGAKIMMDTLYYYSRREVINQ